MNIINAERLLDMLQDQKDLEDLVSLGLTNEEIEGYLEFFATNFINSQATILQDIEYEKY